MPNNPDWWVYQGDNEIREEAIKNLPEAPPWRRFDQERGKQFKSTTEKEKELINAALYLRRPLLVTGKPGSGKTTLAYAVARELALGNVLRWSITTRSTLHEGLYRYDAIARLQDASLQKGKKIPPDIGQYLRLGPLGTAFAAQERLRVLLIDEFDKSDIDLPNDLLHIFEEGEFEIPELARLPKSQQTVFIRPYDYSEKNHKLIKIEQGRVYCEKFPLVIMTSNGEKEFPPAFLRRCLRLEMQLPTEEQLQDIVKAHLGGTASNEEITKLIKEFVDRRDAQQQDLASDQLLNAAYLALNRITVSEQKDLRDALWEALSGESE